MDKNNIKSNTEEFINKAMSIHGNVYDYSSVNYVNAKTKIIINCLKEGHGLFSQTPTNHLSGQGCKMCGQERANVLMTTTRKERILKFKEIHGEKYNYELIPEIINAKMKIPVMCEIKSSDGSIHGIFWPTVDSHQSGHGCSKCYGNNKSNKEEFIKKILNIEKFKSRNYNYDYFEYKNTYTKGKIECPEHGFFLKCPDKHLNDEQGCPSCIEKSSKGEIEIKKFLQKNTIEFIAQKFFKDCINIKTNKVLKFDFYLPQYNMCIEYDGKQHFKAIDYFGGNEEFENTQIRDKIKNEYCINNNIKLIRIKYTEGIEKKLFKTLKNML